MMSDWINVGLLIDVPIKGARTVDTVEGTVAIFRTGDDQVFALVGHRVTCPLHSWVIDLESGDAVAPDVGCAPALPVKLVDGVIWLQIVTRRKLAHA
jgi:nitrite reductase (NADH) small subunit